MQKRYFALGFLFAPAICLLAAAEPAERVPTAAPSASTNNFHPISLDGYYQRLFASYKPTESWAMVPRGVTNLDGVPFRMFGKIDLTGLGRARDGEFQPARVGEIPVGRRGARLHVIHGASYDAPDDTPMACLWLHYNTAEDRKLFIRYGVHARNWYVERSERNASLRDPRTLVVWNGNTRADGAGTPLRLFKTSFDNPRPGDEIRAIELLSLFARANSVILAITLEEAAPPNAVLPPAADEIDDIDLRREVLVRTIDADTGRSVSNVVVEASVTEDERSYGFGSYKSDRHGQILLDYPPGQFQALRLRINDLVNAPFVLNVANNEGIFGLEIPVRLKRQAASPDKP